MQEKHVPFEGGLQLVGTPIGRNPGAMLSCHNYEISIDGGYRRVEGYTSMGTVPGSGPVRGLAIYDGKLYAFRDDAAGTAGAMYRYDGAETGWTLITTPALQPGGRYEFVVHNFYGNAGERKLYGVDGVNKGFEYDGTTFSQISTTMTTDTPKHLIGYKNHLFYAYSGGSVQHSSLGNPTSWTPVTGAGEIGVGDEIQGFSEEVGGSLFIFSRNRIDVLSGSSSSDWVMQPYSSDSGAIAGTIQRLGQSTYLDDRGMLRLEASQAYGNFKAATFSNPIAPLLAQLRETYEITCTQVVRDRGQYRVFFDNGTVLSSTFVGNKLAGITRSFLPAVMVAAASGEKADGTEWVVYADGSGNVYQEGGDSFNGAAILSFFRLQYYHFGSPSRRKQFRRVLFETLLEGDATLAIAPSYDYGSSESPRANAVDFVADVSGVQGYWEASDFGAFNWSVPFSVDDPVRISGLGVNMSLLVSGQTLDAAPHTLYGMLVHYDYRGQKR